MFRLGKKSTVAPVYGNEFQGSNFKRIDSGTTSHRIPQEIVISNPELWDTCDMVQWYMVGRIIRELKTYNALWYCDPKIKKSSKNRLAIKSLLAKNVLIPTETTHIYFVNPVHIRKGDTFAVLATTAHLLSKTTKVNKDHLVNCKPIRDVDFGADRFLLLSQPDAGAN